MTSVQSAIRTFLCTIGAALLVAVPALAQEQMPLTTNSDAAKTHLQEARDYLNNVEFGAARDAADKALEKDPDFAIALMVRGVVSESFADGKSYIEKGTQRRSEVTPGEQHFIDAITARRAGDMKKMRTSIEALAEMYPEDPDVLFMLGQMHFAMREEAKTMETLNKLVEIAPNYDAAYNLLGYRAMHAGNFDEAEKMFKKYVELRPDGPNPYDSIAEYYLKVGDYDNAITHYKKAYETDSRYINAWTRAGLVMAMKGDVDKGEAEIRKALKTAQDAQTKAAAYDAITDAHLLNNDVERALAVLDEASVWAATAAPERVSYFKMGEGWVLYEYGRHDEADQVLKDVKAMIDDEEKVSEEMRPFVKSRATMAEAFLAIEKEDFETAEKAIQKFEKYGRMTGDPGDQRQLHELQGMLAFKQANYETALEHLKQAGDDPHVFYRAGLACKKMGDADQARSYFEKAAKANQPSRSFALFRHRAMAEM